jgi:hypothetical protein
MTTFAPRWDVQAQAEPTFHAYEAGGRPARRYPVGKGEQVRVEVHDDRVFVGWTTPLNAAQWLEALHDLVGVKGNALGLVISAAGTDIRGDLTWRETRALLTGGAEQPTLVRVDVGSVSLMWTAQRGMAAEAAISSPTFDVPRFGELIGASATSGIQAGADEILRDARLVRLWGPDPGSG